jgi:transcription elongation regulator 1
MKKDSRWNLVDLLEREEKEKYFTQHIEQLTRKKREKLRELLDETPEVTLTSSWKEIRRIIKEDPRYTKFSSSERVKGQLLNFKHKLTSFSRRNVRGSSRST